MISVPNVGFTAIAGGLMWFVLGFLLYALVYAAGGSLVSRQEDLASVTSPLTMLVLVTYLAFFWVEANPTNPIGVALSIIPGLGHIYLGHWKKGLVYMAMAGGLQFFGADLDLTGIGAAVGIPMEIGGLGIWAHSAWDAYQIAKRGY